MTRVHVILVRNLAVLKRHRVVVFLFYNLDVPPGVRFLTAILSSRGGKGPFSFIRKVRTSIWQGAGVVRTAEGLQRLIARLTDLAEALPQNIGIRTTSSACNPELGAALELEGMLGLGHLIAKSALRRTESRGAHYREDFPAQGGVRWACNVVVRRGEDGPQLKESPVAAVSGTPE